MYAKGCGSSRRPGCLRFKNINPMIVAINMFRNSTIYNNCFLRYSYVFRSHHFDRQAMFAPMHWGI